MEVLPAADVEGQGVAAEDDGDDPRLTGKFAGQAGADLVAARIFFSAAPSKVGMLPRRWVVPWPSLAEPVECLGVVPGGLVEQMLLGPVPQLPVLVGGEPTHFTITRACSAWISPAASASRVSGWSSRS